MHKQAQVQYSFMKNSEHKPKKGTFQLSFMSYQFYEIINELIYKFMNKSTGNFFLKKKFTPFTPSSKKSTSFTRGQTSASMQNANLKAETFSRHMDKSQVNVFKGTNSAIGQFFKTAKPKTSQQGRYKKRYRSIERQQTYSSSNSRSAMNMSHLYQRKSRKNTLKNSEIKQGSKSCLQLILFSLQMEFTENFKQSNYSKASDVLIKILNYSIDYNMKELFIGSLKRLAEFYIMCCELNAAFFYYNQIRESAILLNENQTLIQSLVGMAMCCRKCEFLDESIVILKKAVEFSWYYEKEELELKIYDEMGKVYYLKGDLDLAQSYHNRFTSASVEEYDSPQRFLSNQRVKKILEQYKTYDQMCVLFLINLKIPILKTAQLPLLDAQKGVPLRDQLEINSKYFLNWQEVRVQIDKVMKETFFSDQTESLDLIVKEKQTNVGKNKRSFDSIDFQLNQHLKKMGINNRKKLSINSGDVAKKQSLDEKVKRKLREPKMDPDWQEKMIREIKRDRKNKLFKIQSIIRVRGKNKAHKPENEEVKKLFAQFFENNRKSQKSLKL